MPDDSNEKVIAERRALPHVSSALWPVVICLGWAALASRSPHVTYHLAPLAAAAAWPVSARLEQRGPLTTRTATAVTVGGLALTLGTALLLAIAGSLGGPALWHGSGALETILAAAVGASWAWRVATRRRRGLIDLLS